jgi:hypothetical protein
LANWTGNVFGADKFKPQRAPSHFIYVMIL